MKVSPAMFRRLSRLVVLCLVACLPGSRAMAQAPGQTPIRAQIQTD